VVLLTFAVRSGAKAGVAGIYNRASDLARERAPRQRNPNTTLVAARHKPLSSSDPRHMCARNRPQLSLIWIKRQAAIPGSMHPATARRRAVTDFCLSPQTFERIVRRTELMDRMIAQLGIKPDACDRDDASTLWCEARFRCIGTRMYFADEEAANAADPVLNLVEQEVRRSTLIAQREAKDGKIVYVFDIRLQGENETVFFDI
jgi:hypothetical protein